MFCKLQADFCAQAKKKLIIFFVIFQFTNVFSASNEILSMTSSDSAKENYVLKSDLTNAASAIEGLLKVFEKNTSTMGFLWAKAKSAIDNPVQEEIEGKIVDGEASEGFKSALLKVKNIFTEAEKTLPTALLEKIKKDVDVIVPNPIIGENKIKNSAKIINALFEASFPETAGLMVKLNTLAYSINSSDSDKFKESELLGNGGFISLFMQIKNKLEKASNLLSEQIMPQSKNQVLDKLPALIFPPAATTTPVANTMPAFSSQTIIQPVNAPSPMPFPAFIPPAATTTPVANTMPAFSSQPIIQTVNAPSSMPLPAFKPFESRPQPFPDFIPSAAATTPSANMMPAFPPQATIPPVNASPPPFPAFKPFQPKSENLPALNLPTHSSLPNSVNTMPFGGKTPLLI